MDRGLAKVLIVDDYKSRREPLCLILAGVGYAVSSAGDASTALAEIRGQTPDIILYNLELTDRCGLAFLSLVRLRFPSIHVVGMCNFSAVEAFPGDFPADILYDTSGGAIELLCLITSMTAPERLWLIRRHSKYPIAFPESSMRTTSGSILVKSPCCPASLFWEPLEFDGFAPGIEDLPGIECFCPQTLAGIAPVYAAVLPFPRRADAPASTREEKRAGRLLQMPCDV